MFSGMTNVTIKEAINAIALQALQRHHPEDIIQTGMAFDKLLADYRLAHPDKVPTKPSMGLLGSGETCPVSDFELALYLVATRPKVMNGLMRLAKEIPMLMAYLAVVSLPSNEWPLREIGWGNALQYAVFESRVKTQQLQDAVAKMAPLAAHGKLFAENRKSGKRGPIAVKVKAYMVKHPKAKSVEVWEALKKAPPKDHDFRETSRLGRYIEKGARTVMEWPRFRNLVSEHRPKK